MLRVKAGGSCVAGRQAMSTAMRRTDAKAFFGRPLGREQPCTGFAKLGFAIACSALSQPLASQMAAKAVCKSL